MAWKPPGISDAEFRQIEDAEAHGAFDALHQAVEADDLPKVVDLIGRWPIAAYAFGPFFRGVELGRTAIVAVLLAAGAKAQRFDELGTTPLMVAAAEGYLDIVRLLVEAGADPDSLAEDVEPNIDWDCRNRSALYHAVEFGYADVADFLAPLTKPGLRLRAELAVPNHSDPADERLNRASASGDIAAIRAELAAGANLGGRTGEDRQTALHAAASAGQAGAVVVLLDAGASIDARDARGRTALWVAVHQGQAGVVEILLERGAAPDARDFDDESTPLITAVFTNNPDVTRMLLARGADAYAPDIHGLSAVDHAEYQDVEEARAVLFRTLEGS